MIRDLTGARRIAFYPYGCGSTRILLDGDASMEDGLPRFVWRVSFDPASAEAETWDQVFSVRTRLDRDLLNCSQIGRWIRSFGEWCRRKLAEDDIANPVVIRAVMLDYAKDAELFPHGRDAYIPQVFRLLHRWCDDDEKLFAFIIDMVRGKPAI
jgi:hypothetical protein